MKNYLIFISTLLLSVTIYAESNIITQLNSPLQILNYEALEVEAVEFITDKIIHKMIYKNVSNKKITAIEFAFISFNVWGEPFDYFTGISFRPLQPDSQRQCIYESEIHTVTKFDSGYVFVLRVKNEDNNIWEADIEKVLEILKAKKYKIDEFDIKKWNKKLI